jgi:hypothetical protein
MDRILKIFLGTILSLEPVRYPNLWWEKMWAVIKSTVTYYFWLCLSFAIGFITCALLAHYRQEKEIDRLKKEYEERNLKITAKSHASTRIPENL